MSARSAQRSSQRLFQPAKQLVLVVLCTVAFVIAVTLVAAAPARAGFYQMVLCAANNGSNSYQTATNTAYWKYPSGIFDIVNYCGPAPYPAGNNAFLRIHDVVPDGTAAETAYASASWTVSPWVAIRAAGGYTRQPESFNDGWRTRFWAEGMDGSAPHNILMQGAGVGGGGIYWGLCSTFCSHLWPFGGYGYYRRFVYEVTCFRPAGCDRAGHNVSDANTFVLILSDEQNSSVGFTGSSAFMSGQWVKGNQTATYSWTENGSGIRFERLWVDNAERFGIDHVAAGQCNRDYWPAAGGEFARNFQPCPTASNIGRSYTFNTGELADGQHAMRVCTQDYGQWQGLSGTGSSSCNERTVRTDNNAPGAPPGLKVNSSNPQRYLPNFGASFSLPPNSGSSVTKVHYSVVNAAGQAVAPEQVLSATNPTELKAIVGPKAPGDYRLKVWLEDQVGWVGAAAMAPIPRDTVPPAAPQDISVTAPESSRASEGFDVRWRNITDAGSPIDKVHYEVVDGAGEVVVPKVTIEADNPQAIGDLSAPQQRGGFSLRMWLSDEEGNVGAPVLVPLAYRCVRSDVAGGAQLGAQVDGAASRVVPQGSGATLAGALQGPAGPTVNAPLCVFSNVVTDQERDFLGLAITARDGGYRFGVAPGPSRNLIVVYRPDHRELTSQAKIETVVEPTFKAKKRVVRNKEFARFYGEIPGPHNDRVVIVLQARRGKGWIAFRRYRTRDGGKFRLNYRFHNTSRPTRYVMRAQVRQTTGYPYLQGNSKRLGLRVLPSRRVRSAPRGR
jgi:hypothetical protein